MNQQIADFWTWFSNNEKRFWNYNEQNSYELLIEIQKHLDFTGGGIALEFSKVSETKKRLEISADGDIRLFDTIIKIVDQSPLFANWEIVAFRQPIPSPFCLTFESMVFDVSEMQFLPFENEKKELNVIVFGENFKNYNENSLFHYGLTTIDNLIGEYNCVMKIKAYDFVDKDEIGNNKVYPLAELPHFLDDYYKNS